jgi:hypothetical protein
MQVPECQPGMFRSRHADKSGCHVFDRRESARGVFHTHKMSWELHRSQPKYIKLHMWTRTKPPKHPLQVRARSVPLR